MYIRVARRAMSKIRAFTPASLPMHRNRQGGMGKKKKETDRDDLRIVLLLLGHPRIGHRLAIIDMYVALPFPR
jgi:hypothetical protein